MIYTTLNKIKGHNPHSSIWEKLLSNLGKNKLDDEPLSLKTILESNGTHDAFWALRAVDGHDKEIRLFAVACARRVQHLMTDPRSIRAVDVAEKYANGECGKEELAAARDAAWAATEEATGNAARCVAWAAAVTARAYAKDYMDAVDAVTWLAAAKKRDEQDDVDVAAWCAANAARDAEIEWQKQKFIRIFCSEEA